MSTQAERVADLITLLSHERKDAPSNDDLDAIHKLIDEDTHADIVIYLFAWYLARRDVTRVAPTLALLTTMLEMIATRSGGAQTMRGMVKNIMRAIDLADADAKPRTAPHESTNDAN